MSSQLFSANILNAISEPVAHCLKDFLAINQDSDCYRELEEVPVSQADLALFTEEDLTTLQIETGTSVDFDFFEHVYQILEAAGAEFQDVTLFDSSTGTHHVFESIFDLDIEFDGKHMIFLGDMEDLEEMQELTENAILQTVIDENTELAVVGNHVDDAQLAQLKKQNALTISEAHFWAIINSE